MKRFSLYGGETLVVGFAVLPYGGWQLAFTNDGAAMVV
jgi:hypothetical protein